MRICPKCKSIDVEADLSAQSYGKGSFFNQYKCNSCGYTGIFFPEIENKTKKARKSP